MPGNCNRAELQASPRHRIQGSHLADTPPHENIVVNNSTTDDARHGHVEVAVKDAFAAARRQIDALAV
jgi:hypothetical protein